MQVLVGYESSGIVREAFRARGHDAWSCDLLPADDGSPHHFQNDVRHVIGYEPWDLVILHPPCTYLTVSAAWAFLDPDFERYPGVGYHQRVKPGTLTGQARRDARGKAIAEIVWLMGCGLTYCIENPARSFISTAIRPPDQVVQPNRFGEDASKATGLWFNVPEDIVEHHILPLRPLVPTKRVPGRIVDGKERWANQTNSGQNKETPSDDRWKRRAKTYPGIATAMADQWGGQIERDKQC